MCKSCQNVWQTSLLIQVTSMTLSSICFWCDNDKNLSDNQVIYLSDIDSSTIKVTQQGSAVLKYKSDHGEANTKMFTYGKCIFTEHSIKKMNISSPDTDVAVICFQLISCLESIN